MYFFLESDGGRQMPLHRFSLPPCSWRGALLCDVQPAQVSLSPYTARGQPLLLKQSAALVFVASAPAARLPVYGMYLFIVFSCRQVPTTISAYYEQTLFLPKTSVKLLKLVIFRINISFSAAAGRGLYIPFAHC